MDAYVTKDENGQIILIDPVAEALIYAVAKANCKIPFDGQQDRVLHFKNRIVEKGLSVNDVVIVLINVDAPNGDWITEALMLGHNWQQYRDNREIPFARGLVKKEGMIEMLNLFDQEASKKTIFD